LNLFYFQTRKENQNFSWLTLVLLQGSFFLEGF